MRVEVRDKEGKLLAVRVNRSDLILNNFKKALATWLTPFQELAAGARKKVELVDMGGTTQTVTIWANDAISSGYGLTFTAAQRDPFYPVGARIWVGTSTVSPTRNDYKLGADVGYATPSQTIGADYISWAASIVLETAADVAEAGLSCFFQLGWKVATDWRQILMFRDTFTPISVPAGGTISITYTLTL